MPAKARLLQSGFQRFMQSLLLGAAGSIMTTAAAQAQACPAAVGGTITIASGVTCGPLGLSGGTNLVVDNGGKITTSAVSTVAGPTQGNITINGEVSQTFSGNALTANPGTSVGNVLIGQTGRVSSGVTAIDYRNVSTSLGSFTNYGTISSGVGAFSTSVATVGGNIANYGSMTAVGSGIYTQNQTINGDIINGKTLTATGNITITGTGNNASGIRLFSNVNLRGNLINEGTITGVVGSGVNITSGILTAATSSIGGALTNSGRISGYNIGVNLSGTTVTGAATNTATGVIEAANVGARFSGGQLSSFLNAGQITTSGTASENNGVYLLSGARVTGGLTNANLISGQAGAIGAKTSGIRLDSASLVSATLAGAAPAADPEAAIDPAAVDLAAATVSLVNSGTIQGYNYGVRITSSTVTGSVTNSNVITSVDSGILASSSSVGGDVVNSGSIDTSGAAATSDGVELQTVTLTGNLTNSGQIRGQAGTGGATTAGILTNGGSIGGAVTNSGRIAGYNFGMSLTNTPVTGAVANAATGVIEATGVGVSLSGVTAASLQKLGSIAAVTQGLNVSGGTLGSLTNGGTITTTGAASENNGVYLLSNARITGDLTNTGTISGAAGAGAAKTSGIRLSSASLGGSLLSSGEIKGYNYGVRLDSSPVTGSVSNSGKITAVDDGFLSTSSVSGGVKNLAGGTITAGGYGVNLNDARASYGGVLNAGAMTTVLSGVRASTVTVNGDVVNSGTIDTSGAGATSNGVELQTVTLTGNLTNSGQIRGKAGTGGATTAGILTSGGSIGGSVTNSGTVSGYDYGLRLTNTPIAGALTNSGGVTSVADAVALSGASIGGDVSNTSTGVINAGGYGFNIANFASMGAFTNAGSITSGNSAMLASSGTINGDVLNTGAITTTGTAATSNGIGLQTATVTGGLTNSGTMSGQAGTAGAPTTGILTSGGSIAGVVINSGTISGYDYGLWLTNTRIGGALTNSGGIASVADAVALAGSSIGGDVTNTSTGAINAGGYGFNIANFGSMGVFTNAGAITSGNSAMFASTGTINGDVLNTGAITTTGTAATSNGIGLQTATITGGLSNSGTMSGQAGTNGAKTTGILTSGGSIAGVVINSGTISGYDYGLWLTNTPIGGALTNSGGIASVADAVALSGSSIGGDVSNTSTGVISAGGYGFKLANFGSMGAFANAGAITSGNSAMFASSGTINGDVLNTGAITTTGTAATSNGIELQTATVIGNLVNSGTMRGQAGANGAITTGVLTSGGSIAGRVINSGNVSGYNDGFSLSGTTVGGAIDNTGGVYAARYGFNLADAGTIGAFNNFGAIAAGMAGVNATGSTQIQNMTNAQGVGNSAGPLTYSGTLPSNYFIVINGGSYGQLGVDPGNHSGQMTFAISPLSSGVAPRIYSTVLTGVSISDLTNPNSVQATFGDRGKLMLRQQAGSATSWDLAIEGFWNPYIGFNNPNVGSTYKAINANRMATEGVLHQRYAVLNAAMQYDCDSFDKYGVCLQFQSRETGFGTQSTGAGVINASYRVADRFRIGAYLDYQAWARTPFGLMPATGGVQQGYNSATFGGYVGYSAHDDQTGMQARVSGGYNGGRVSVIRAFLAGSEPGFGDARLNAFYLYGVAGYGLKLRNGMIVTPYGGLQYTGVTREAYMETFAPETIFPLIYNPYYERLVTGLAGVKVSGMLGAQVGYQAAMGGQFDLSRNANAYGGMSAAPGMESFGVAHGGDWNGVRPSGMAGLFYAPLPNHRLSINAYANQQAWTNRTYVSSLLGYQIGF